MLQFYPGLGGSHSGHSDSYHSRISTPTETKFGMASAGGIGGGGNSAGDNIDMKLGGGGNGGGANPRSPLSLAAHHHHAAAAAFDYGRAMMGSHAAVSAGLGVGSSVGTAAANSTNTNGEVNGGGLRITTPNEKWSE